LSKDSRIQQFVVANLADRPAPVDVGPLRLSAERSRLYMVQN
jgi:hypothetical protein